MLSKLTAFALGVAVSAALLMSLVAFGQGELRGLIHPAVIDIQQEVPVLAEIDGATVPFTVGVSLRVDLSGPVTASVEAVPTPAVEVATTTPVVAAGQLEYPGHILLDDVRYQVSDAIDSGQVFDYMGGQSANYLEHTEARFVTIVFNAVNEGTRPIELSNHMSGYGDYIVYLADEDNRQFIPYRLKVADYNECTRKTLNPGISTTCWMVFELPDVATNLRLQFREDVQEIPIPVLRPAD